VAVDASGQELAEMGGPLIQHPERGVAGDDQLPAGVDQMPQQDR
jgi:hypothetical protein